MRLRVIHVSRYAPDMPALWVDTSEEKPILKAYVNGRYQTLSEEIPAGILTEDMIVNSLDSDAIDMPLSAAQGKILKSLLDEKQAALTPGIGIEITDDNTINVTLDTTVFKVVPSLPDSPAPEDMNKIHLVPSENVGENNSYKEYLWVNNKWEEIGTYVSTVDLTSYLTKEDAGKTYQTITDSSLQTQDKTVPGAINEVNAGLEEVVKPYVINLTGLLAAQDSQSISTAIGGIDNLNGTVQKNQVIFGTLANGTVAVGIRVLGNQTTLTYFVDSVVGLTVNEVIITNTSGTLTKTANTHAVLTENMVIDSLDSDETTLPLSAAQGKALNEKIQSSAFTATLHKIYESYGAVYNAETGYWKMFGLIDLTEEDMYNIWYENTYKTFSSNSIDNLCTILWPTNKARIRFLEQYDSTYAIYSGFIFSRSNYNLEVFRVIDSGLVSSQLNIVGKGTGLFYGCRNLRDAGTISVSLITNFTDNNIRSFYSCIKLNTVFIKTLKVNISFQDSPLLSYESINYLVDNAANTAAITVTVHPTTYSYLTGTTQPTEEVGGTTEEWQTLVTTAQGKQISFAVSEETQSEVTE